MTEDEDTHDTSRPHCVGCGVLSPATETSYTLISARHGWRVTRGIDAAGRSEMEWRCPRCWEIFRAQAG